MSIIYYNKKIYLYEVINILILFILFCILLNFAYEIRHSFHQTITMIGVTRRENVAKQQVNTEEENFSPTKTTSELRSKK